MTNLIQKHQNQINKIIRESAISYLAIYGSFARGEQRTNSDIDMLVDFDKPIDLIDLIQTQHKLEDLLQHKVDLITKKGVSPHLRPYIEKDLQVIYEKT